MMIDMTKVLTEVRRIVHASPCHCHMVKMPCRRCAALAAFTADMPGAIGWFVERGCRLKHRPHCVAHEVGESCSCGYDAALAKLKTAVPDSDEEIRKRLRQQDKDGHYPW